MCLILWKLLFKNKRIGWVFMETLVLLFAKVISRAAFKIWQDGSLEGDFELLAYDGIGDLIDSSSSKYEKNKVTNLVESFELDIENSLSDLFDNFDLNDAEKDVLLNALRENLVMSGVNQEKLISLDTPEPPAYFDIAIKQSAVV